MVLALLWAFDINKLLMLLARRKAFIYAVVAL